MEEIGRAEARTAFVAAALSFAGLVGEIGPDAWNREGLGVWNVRDLVGHTSRALVTVIEYVKKPAVSEDISNPAEYYVLAKGTQVDPSAVAERGRQAGLGLGSDPVRAVGELAERAAEIVNSTPDDALITTIGGGMRLGAYLPTRTFELVVHGLDIASSTGLASYQPPQPALEDAVALAGRIAVQLGAGPVVLRALTGRAPLPASFCIV